MLSASEPSTSPVSPGPSRTPGPASGTWIGWSLAAGLVVAIPSGLLLMYLAALPFMLGLFFFLLLGLITGATMFRFGSTAANPSAAVLWLIGSTVTAVMMLTSLWGEYHLLPGGLFKVVRESYYESHTSEWRSNLLDHIGRHVSSRLNADYPPGGFTGYLRWAATSGEMTCPRFFEPGEIDYRLPQRRRNWLIRVGLSALLVEWAVLSQVLGLRALSRRRRDDSDSPDGERPHETPDDAPGIQGVP